MRRSILLILSALGALTTAAAAPLTYYVSPQGDDSYSGTISAPFRTLSKARDAIRSDTGRNSPSQTQIQGNWEGATVIIRNGTYPSLALDGRDSGTESDPIVYRAATGEQVSISGAVKITEGHWTPVRDPLYPDAHPKVRQLALYKFNIKDSNDLNTPGPRTEFYVDGKPIRSRVQNLEELKQPGEWFLDTGRNQLFYFPKNENELKNASLSSVDTVFSATGTRWTKLENLTIEASRSHGVVLMGTEHITMSSVTVRNTGEWGIRIEGGSGALVSNTVVTESGSGGIFVEGGDGASGVTSGHTVENAEIRDFAKTWQSEPGIMLMGFGNRVAGSSITGSSDGVEPTYGILIGGAHGNIVRQNVFSNCEIPIFINSSGGLLAGKNEIVDNRSIDSSWLVDGDGAAVQLTHLNFSSDGVTKVQLGDLLKSSSSNPALPTPTTGLVFYVSPNGKDSNSGTTAQSPFATLEAARNAIRAATGRSSKGGAPSGNWDGATVILMSGLHKRTTTFTLDNRDGGTKAFPIQYVGSGNTSIDGSISLKQSDWVKVTPADSFAWSRLPTATRDKTWKVSLSSLGVAVGAVTNNSSRAELIDGNQLREMARYPAYPVDRTDAPDFLRMNSVVNGKTGVFTDNDSHLADYKLESQSPVIWHFPKVEYAGRWDRISIAGEGDTKTITPSTYAGVGGSSITPMSIEGEATGRYAIYNCLEDLNVPGTFCLVEDSSSIYYLPPDGAAPTTARVTGMNTQMVEGDGVSWVNFRDVTFEGGRRDGWFLYSSSDMRFDRVRFRNMGVGTGFGTGGRATYWGGVLSTDRGSLSDNCDRLTFSDCTFEFLGGRALGIITGDRSNLLAGDCLIEKTTFRQNNRLQRTIPNLNVTGWGFEVNDCLFTELPFVGIQHYALTHLHHSRFIGVLLEGGDYGATYTSNSATANRGTIIEYNHIEKVGAHRSPTPPHTGSAGWGVYLDDLVSGVTVHRNVFINCGNGIQFTGSDHTITENQFTNCHHLQDLSENETMVLGNRTAHTAKIASRDAEMLDINGSGKTVAQEPWATYWPGGAGELPGGGQYSVRMKARNNVVRNNSSTTRSPRWAPPTYPFYVLIHVRDASWLQSNQPDFFTQQNYAPGSTTLRNLGDIDRE